MDAQDYTVVWTIELSAFSPRGAAKKALKIQRDKASTATVFVVDGEQIDLSEEPQGLVQNVGFDPDAIEGYLKKMKEAEES